MTEPETFSSRTQEAADLATADRVRVECDAFRRLRLRLDDQTYEDVRVVRAFPLSQRAPYLSFLNSEGKEIALLADPENLDDASRRVVEAALAEHYFAPRITRVYRISETWGVAHWEVETDCGPARFEVVDREKIRRLPNGGLIIVDADENRFVVEDVDALDPFSRHLVLAET